MSATQPASTTELKEYCLRKLGKPVIDINLADEQMNDMIDESIQMFQEYHFDGVEKVFLKHTLTQTDIDNEYIAMADPVISVIRVLPIPNFNAFQTGFFNEEFQLRIQDLNTFTGS